MQSKNNKSIVGVNGYFLSRDRGMSRYLISLLSMIHHWKTIIIFLPSRCSPETIKKIKDINSNIQIVSKGNSLYLFWEQIVLPDLVKK